MSVLSECTNRWSPCVLIVTLLLFGSSLQSSSAQSSTTQSHATVCTLEKHIYKCNRSLFLHALTRARTVAVEASDRGTEDQLRKLVGTLHKSLARPNESADLIFRLGPMERDDVMFGPAAIGLARLGVYEPNSNGGVGNLVWAETLRGQPDISWPAQVQLLIQQFKTQIGKK